MRAANRDVFSTGFFGELYRTHSPRRAMPTRIDAHFPRLDLAGSD
jgi:hypothetical protein